MNSKLSTSYAPILRSKEKLKPKSLVGLPSFTPQTSKKINWLHSGKLPEVRGKPTKRAQTDTDGLPPLNMVVLNNPTESFTMLATPTSTYPLYSPQTSSGLTTINGYYPLLLTKLTVVNQFTGKPTFSSNTLKLNTVNHRLPARHVCIPILQREVPVGSFLRARVWTSATFPRAINILLMINWWLYNRTG